MANSLVDWTPSSGQVTSPRPLMWFKTNFASTVTALRVKATFIKGLETVIKEDFWYAVSGKNFGGIREWNFYPDNDLADGTWSYTLEVRWSTSGGGSWSQATGSPTASRSFTVASVVSVTPIAPAPGTWEPYQNVDTGGGTMGHYFNFQWDFASNGLDDYQTEIMIEVRRKDTQASVVNIAPATSNEYITWPIVGTYVDIPLEWRIKVANRSGTYSPFSEWRDLGFGTPPTSSISTPTADQTLNSGVIDFDTSVTTTAGRTIKKVEASVWQGTDRLWARTYDVNLASGAAYTIEDATFILSPNDGEAPYQLRVAHVDSIGLRSVQATRNFNVSYNVVAPTGAITLNAAVYNSAGYVELSWANTQQDASFYAWSIERRETDLHPYTGDQTSVVSDWAEVGRVYDVAANYTYRDYFARSNTHAEYRIRQVAIRDGQEVKSAGTSPTAGVDVFTDAYWLIAEVSLNVYDAQRLYNVTSDSFTEEIIVNEYNLIGRGRYVERGDELGIKGSLVCKFRDEGNLTAREKRLKLNTFKQLYTRATLRNPFGDSYTVSLGDIAIDRIPGTGKSEYVDVTIPYSEVAQ